MVSMTYVTVLRYTTNEELLKSLNLAQLHSIKENIMEKLDTRLYARFLRLSVLR